MTPDDNGNTLAFSCPECKNRLVVVRMAGHLLPDMVKQHYEAEHQGISVPQLKIPEIDPRPYEQVMGLLRSTGRPCRKPMTHAEMAERAKSRPAHYHLLSEEEQWKIDKRLGILDWDGTGGTD
jgi:hypothetical protein